MKYTKPDESKLKQKLVEPVRFINSADEEVEASTSSDNHVVVYWNYSLFWLYVFN